MSETNTPRKYFSKGGIEVGLLWLIRNSPEWAENQIRHRDRLETELAAANERADEYKQVAEELEKALNKLNALYRGDFDHEEIITPDWIRNPLAKLEALNQPK